MQFFEVARARSAKAGAASVTRPRPRAADNKTLFMGDLFGKG
jgi:hypothetical protein